VAEQRATRQALLTAVESLGEEDREVVVCRYFLELSGQETAAALGIAEGTVKSRLSRALAKLRGRFDGNR
jgi:RNA polymerase sigma-70 factor (ECF subfamily)